MRKTDLFLIVLAGMWMLTSCQKNVEFIAFDESTNIEATLKSNRISLNEAIKIATDGIAMLESTNITRATTSRRVDTNLIKYKIASATRAGEDADTLYYVVNYADNAGFAIVAATRTNENPLLVVTEKGNYTPDEETDNDGFNLYMDLLDIKMSARDGGDRPRPGVDTGFDGLGPFYDYDTHESNKGPFLTVRWGQHDPYYMYCKTSSNQQALTGCVATAIAQIMSYHEYPITYTPTYSTSIPTQYLTWSSIKNHIDTYNCYCSNHDAIGHLFREIGSKASIVYEVGNSSTSDLGAFLGLTGFGYNANSVSTYDYWTVKSDLDNNRPVYMSGRPSNSNIKHAWVIDGYKIITSTRITYFILDDGSQNITERLVSSERYLHINWGRDGNSNGYFQEGTFDTTEYYQLDIGLYTDEYFDADLVIINGIYPNK